MGFIKEQFGLTNKFIKEKLLLIFVILFILFVALSAVVCVLYRMLPEQAIEEFMLGIVESFDSNGVVGDNGEILYFPLFFNNLNVAVLSFVIGFVPFLFFPLMIYLFNVLITGAVIGAASVLADMNPLYMVITTILPHGVFEIPAVILAWAAGTYICLLLCKKIFRQGKDVKILYCIKRMSGVFCFYIIPLLLIAAFIEAIILPMFLM